MTTDCENQGPEKGEADEPRTGEIVSSVQANRDSKRWSLPLLFSLGGLLINAALLYVTYNATEAARSSADAAKFSADMAAETLRLSQRSWLAVSNFVLENYREGETPEIKYGLVNAGQSPALLARIQSGYSIGTLPDEPNYSTERLFYNASVPVGSSRVEARSLTPDLVAKLRQADASGLRWWFHIRVEYSDRFGEYAYCTVAVANIDNARLDIYPAADYHCNE